MRQGQEIRDAAAKGKPIMHTYTDRGGRTHRLGTVSIHDGGNMIDYTEEDPAIREIFEQQLRDSGVESQMR